MAEFPHVTDALRALHCAGRSTEELQAFVDGIVARRKA
jgi:hypothetical protein